MADTACNSNDVTTDLFLLLVEDDGVLVRSSRQDLGVVVHVDVNGQDSWHGGRVQSRVRRLRDELLDGLLREQLLRHSLAALLPLLGQDRGLLLQLLDNVCRHAWQQEFKIIKSDKKMSESQTGVGNLKT